MMNTPKSIPAVARFFRARVGAANFPPRSPSGLYRIESAMLFLPRKVYDARVILLKDLEDGKIASADIYQAMLDLDPDDHIAMLGLGGLRKKAGDTASAKEYFWRALYAHPTVNIAYLELGNLYFDEPGAEALAKGLIELGLSRHAQELPEAVYEDSGIKGEALEEFLNLPAETRRRLFMQSLRERRTLEPAETTARLRGLRLLLDLHESDPVESKLVDAILDEGASMGESMVPLLIGLLRDWAQDFLVGEESDTEIESALALIGETAAAAEIRHLLEFVDLDNLKVSGAARWALARILERHPHESVQLLASIIPQLGPAERLEIASQILLRPALDPAGDLHIRLTQNLENIDSESRNDFFPLLLGSMAFARGPLGMRLGRKALEQQRGRLSKAVCRECVELLRAAAEGGLSPLPIEPSPYNVYEICAGEAIWEEEEEEDDEEESLPEPIPQPGRRMAAPGRNDPCWCGSGKKYKKCHLDADEGQQREPRPAATSAPGMNEFAPLRKRLGALPGELVSAGELKRACQEFSGEQEADQMMLLDWILHDWIPPSLGRGMMDEFLLRHGTRLTPRERQMVEAWARSYVGLYEVQRLIPGTGADVKDLTTGETMFVHDISLSKSLVRWDVFLGRLLPGERGTELTGAALSVSRVSLEPLREWMYERRRESGQEWPEFLKRNWPRIRLQSYEARANWVKSVRLTNTDGEELLVSKATYRLTDEAAVRHALRNSDEIAIDDGSGREVFVWLDQKKTILGHIRIDAGQLVIDCNSRERHDRGSRLLSRLAGKHLAHLRDEFTSQAELRRQAKESPAPELVENQIPKEERDRVIMQYLEKHYQEWPDMQLPALDGKTPRAAVRSARGRQQVMEILKMMENGEERKRLDGEPSYDMDRLRAELKLE